MATALKDALWPSERVGRVYTDATRAMARVAYETGGVRSYAEVGRSFDPPILKSTIQRWAETDGWNDPKLPDADGVVRASRTPGVPGPRAPSPETVAAVARAAVDVARDQIAAAYDEIETVSRGRFALFARRVGAANEVVKNPQHDPDDPAIVAAEKQMTSADSMKMRDIAQRTKAGLHGIAVDPPRRQTIEGRVDHRVALFAVMNQVRTEVEDGTREPPPLPEEHDGDY